MVTLSDDISELPLLGIEEIQLFLPHRKPFLFINDLLEYIDGDQPLIRASIYINNFELVNSFNSELNYLPSCYIIEGLGQCCNLLSILTSIEKQLHENEQIVPKMNLILRSFCKKEKSNHSKLFNEILSSYKINTLSRIGLLGSIDVEITGKACMGEMIIYQVQQTQTFGNLSYFETNAYVSENKIAKGKMIGSREHNY